MAKLHKSEDEWREALTPNQYAVCRQKATEPAFSGKYNSCKLEGTYQCVACGQPLFSSEHKFDSGSGWPSFYAPLDQANVQTEEDVSHGMRRVEVLCSACESHLGHVFPDGPAPSGQRFCINSLALKLDCED